MAFLSILALLRWSKWGKIPETYILALKSIVGKSGLSFGATEKVSGIFPHLDRHTLLITARVSVSCLLILFLLYLSLLFPFPLIPSRMDGKLWLDFRLSVCNLGFLFISATVQASKSYEIQIL